MMATLLLASCMENDSTANKDQLSPQTDSISLITTGTQLLPALQSLDSIRAMFYLDPFGADAERYTRYYTEYLAGSSDTLLPMITNAINQSFLVSDTLRDCRSEGKMYLYRSGKVAQVLYFSQQNENCIHLYMIHEARYYYFPLSPELYNKLTALEALVQKKP